VPKERLVVPQCRILLGTQKYEQVLQDCAPDAVPASERVGMQIVVAAALLHEDRPAEALAVLEQAVKAEPDNIDAFLTLVSAKQIGEDPVAAKELLDSAPKSIRDTPRYWLALGGLNVLTDDMPAAEKSYQTALDFANRQSESGEKIMALGGLAEVQVRSGKLDAAEETSGKLMAIAPNHPLVRQLRAQVLAARGQVDEARGILEDIVSRQPQNTGARSMLAVVNAQQGNYDQAQMHLQTVVAQDPKDVRAQRLLAELRARLQGPQESLSGVELALDDSPDDPTMLAAAGRLSLESGDKEQALTYLAAADKAGGKDDVQAKLDVATGYLQAGEIDRAIEVLESMPTAGVGTRQRDTLLLLTLLRKGDQAQLLEEAQAIVARSPKDAGTRTLVGGVYAAAGKPDLAREQLTQAQKLAPNDPNPPINLGKLDLSQGNNAGARANFKRALDVDPKNLTATLGLAAVANLSKDPKGAEQYLLQARKDHPAAIEPVLGLAQVYANGGQPAKARALVDEAAKANPKNAAMANARGIVLLGLQDAPGAIASFEEAIRLEPANAGHALGLARARLANRDAKGALAAIDEALKVNPKAVAALALGAATAIRSGNGERASGYLERLRAVAPDAQGTYMLEGDLAMAQKRYKDALANYRRASARGSNSALAISEYRAAMLAGESNPEKGLEAWVASNPADAAAVGVLAEVRSGQGRTEEAVRLYESALAKNPDNIVLLNNVAVIYGAKNDPKALDYAARAYKVAPKAPWIMDTYGWILFRQNKVDQALPLLRDAAKAMPDNAEVQYHYAAALAKKGDKQQAVALLNKATRGTMPADQKADAQKLLKQLGQ
jgi:putative PEP-CTERM system TPR-repeat lipoprotein